MQNSNDGSSLNLFTPEELMKELGVSRRTLRRYELAGMIPAIHLSKRCIRFRRCDVESMLDRFTYSRRHSSVL
ncbi:helix-turn-helix transcriptional regulator [Thalassobacterium sedimentorum]|uniref:helix-turn-helix transcriptional regulator n=1 Tax=Thalassobacterium sedimentorum TaxID=3041258 RepID=UPI003CE55417